MLNGENLTALNKVRTEFWAIGMRNPWRVIRFRNRAISWMADVGGGSWRK